MNNSNISWLNHYWSQIKCLPWESNEPWVFMDVDIDRKCLHNMSSRGLIVKTGESEEHRRRAVWQIAQDVREYVVEDNADKYDWE